MTMMTRVVMMMTKMIKKTPIERRYDHVAALSPRHTLALPLDAGENE